MIIVVIFITITPTAITSHSLYVRHLSRCLPTFKKHFKNKIILKALGHRYCILILQKTKLKLWKVSDSSKITWSVAEHGWKQVCVTLNLVPLVNREFSPEWFPPCLLPVVPSSAVGLSVSQSPRARWSTHPHSRHGRDPGGRMGDREECDEERPQKGRCREGQDLSRYNQTRPCI